MMTQGLHCLAALSADTLTKRLLQIRKEERALLVEFLYLLTELERRRVPESMGYSSIFSFCTGHLGMSKGSAYRRMTASRLVAAFPVISEYLADGRLGLLTLVALRDVLSKERLTEILDRAAGRTEEQVKELVAAINPRPDQPELLRRIPVWAVPVAALGSSVEPRTGEPTGPLAAAPERSRGTIEPLSADRHVLRLTVGSAFVCDLEAVRQALSHKLPGGSLDHQTVAWQVEIDVLQIVFARTADRDEAVRLGNGGAGLGHRCGENRRCAG